MHHSHVWGIRSNEPSEEERYQRVLDRLTYMVRMLPVSDRRNNLCYQKALELLKRGRLR